MLHNEKIKQESDIEQSFIWEIKLQKEPFLSNITDFSTIEGSIFKLCQDCKIHTYATSEELNGKTFTLNNKNIKQEIGIELTFTLETRIQN